jgi:hypothetical protein
MAANTEYISGFWKNNVLEVDVDWFPILAVGSGTRPKNQNQVKTKERTDGTADVTLVNPNRN